MPKETEIKLHLPPEAINQVLSQPCFAQATAGSTLSLRNHYFDTPDLALSAARVALRIREQDGSWIQTLKTQGSSVNGLHVRNEWEWPLSAPTLDLALLQTADLPDSLYTLLENNQLACVFTTHFERQLFLLRQQDGTLIELALDRGEVACTAANGEQRSEPINELELELKQGSVELLKTVASGLQQAVPALEPSEISKAQRGYQLLKS